MPDKLWNAKYCSELDRGKRIQMLEEAIAESGELTPELELRQKLLNARYQYRGKDPIDTFLRGYVEIGMLTQGQKKPKINRRTQKSIDSILGDLQIDTAAAYGEEGLKILEEEFYNMLLFYMAISKDSMKFSRSMMGIKKVSDETRMKRFAEDLFLTTSEIPALYGFASQTAPLKEAAEAAFADVFNHPLAYVLELDEKQS